MHNDNIFNILSLYLAMQNLQENREQSANNNVQTANDKQAKQMLEIIKKDFEHQEALINTILSRLSEIETRLDFVMGKLNIMIGKNPEAKS